MSHLADLKQSISELSNEQLNEMLRDIRLNRRTAAPAKKTTAKKSAAMPDLSKMSDQDKLALIALLESQAEATE